MRAALDRQSRRGDRIVRCHARPLRQGDRGVGAMLTPRDTALVLLVGWAAFATVVFFKYFL